MSDYEIFEGQDSDSELLAHERNFEEAFDIAEERGFPLKEELSGFNVVFDLGCGRGTGIPELRKHCPEAKIFGVDKFMDASTVESVDDMFEFVPEDLKKFLKSTEEKADFIYMSHLYGINLRLEAEDYKNLANATNEFGYVFETGQTQLSIPEMKKYYRLVGKIENTGMGYRLWQRKKSE